MARYQPIKDWPEDDRPREKLLKKGAQALSDTELLAIILRSGTASTGVCPRRRISRATPISGCTSPSVPKVVRTIRMPRSE